MANFDTGLDILTDVCKRAGELAPASADLADTAKRVIQASYVTVVSRFPWPWAKKEPPGVFATVDEYTTGSIAVTKGSTTITFSEAPTGLSFATRKFMVDGDEVVYRIAAHTESALTATLDLAYLGTSSTATTYHVFQDEYNLDSTFLAPIRKQFLRDAHGRYAVDLVGEDELSAQHPYPGTGSTQARYCCFVADQRIRLYPWPTEARRYEYAYIYHPGVLSFDGSGADDTPIIQPAEDRVVLALYGIGNLLLDKNDDRAEAYLQGAGAKLQSMMALATKTLRGRIWMRPQYSVSTRR